MSSLLASRPRPVYCVNEHEHRDRALAEAVVAGRFEINGETCELGLEPDWLHADLPSDEEWRIDWVKFYYGLDLADAYRATGEQRFVDAWERLVASWILQSPPDFDAAEVTARRVLNWIYAWQRLPELSDTVADALVGSLGEQARHIRATLAPERNHRTLELYALLIVALALPELDGGLLEFAVTELHRNLLTDFRPDGVHREASTHYHVIALRSFVGARENCRRYGVELPAGFDTRLSAACDFARDCMRPDGTLPALSDADSGDYRGLLALAGRLLGRADLLAPRAASHPDGGYWMQRSGERYLIFDCGPLGDGGHGHYDLLSVEAWAGARPLVMDPGRLTYAEPLRRWFRGTAAHNTVCVDGFDQTPYARGRSGRAPALGRFLGRRRVGQLDVLAGEARSPVYDAVHRRRVVFTGAYWLVEDRLTADTPHRYDLRWHLGPEAWGLARTVVGGGVVAPSVTLVVRGAEPALEDGWISPRYGERLPAPVVTAVAHGTEATFVTLLAPRAPGAPTATLCHVADGAYHVDHREEIVLGEAPLDVRWRRL